MLNLTIINLITSNISQGACDNFTWNNTTYTTSGIYTFSTQSVAGCDSLATLSLTIYSSPVATISPADTITFCPLNPVLLSANSGMSSYLWSNGATTSSINASTEGNYTVQIIDSNGCSSTSTNTVVLVNITQSDFNNDGSVDIDDFILFTPTYGLPCTCEQDLNNDGVVDIDDFLLFVPTFGTSCQ